MGVSRNFWAGNLMKIFKVSGSESFTWSQVTKAYPDITKSVLSRLKCSGWIQKDKRPIIVNGKPKPSKTVLWRLHPEAITLCKNGGYVNKPKSKKIIKTCNCPSKKIIKTNK
jgi:hypothetical protein